MAIEVGYFKNTTECYSEGPFVMVEASGWRVEVWYRDSKCPSLPDPSIYAFLRHHGLPDSKSDDRDRAVLIIDFLNRKAKSGELTNTGITWVWGLYETELAYQKNQSRRYGGAQFTADCTNLP